MGAFITPVELVVPNTGSFEDVDVSGACPPGTVGVFGRIIEADNTPRTIALRKNGSTVDVITTAPGVDPVLDSSSQIAFFVGVDANRLFEVNFEAAGGPEEPTRLVMNGYFGPEDAVFFTNSINMTTGALGAFVDYDISPHVLGGDTAIAAIVTIYPGQSVTNTRTRPKGSTDDIPVTTENIRPHIVGVDGSNVFQVNRERATDRIFLDGYVKLGAGDFPVNAVENLSVVGGGVYGTLAPLTNSNAKGALFDIVGGASGQQYNIRKNGSTQDEYHDRNRNRAVLCIEADENQLVEAKFSSTASPPQVFETGYLTFGAAGRRTNIIT